MQLCLKNATQIVGGVFEKRRGRQMISSSRARRASMRSRPYGKASVGLPHTRGQLAHQLRAVAKQARRRLLRTVGRDVSRQLGTYRLRHSLMGRSDKNAAPRSTKHRLSEPRRSSRLCRVRASGPEKRLFHLCVAKRCYLEDESQTKESACLLHEIAHSETGPTFIPARTCRALDRRL